MIRRLEEYPLWLRDTTIERVGALHNLVGEFGDRLLTDPILQEVLLNDGYEMEPEERPKSKYALMASIPGAMLRAHLSILEHTKGAITEDSPIIVPDQRIVAPNEVDAPLYRTPKGIPVEAVERLKEQWKSDPIVQTINQYEATLKEALEEYFNQGMNSKLGGVLHLNFPREWKEERGIQRKVVEIWDAKSSTVLDDAYYSMGKMFHPRIAKMYEQLAKDDFGKLFILSQDEARKVVFA
ncbi:Uncharacterised protein [uncultured archaeon]|nr:Uncharacterised protein [uncultured archaeon]